MEIVKEDRLDGSGADVKNSIKRSLLLSFWTLSIVRISTNQKTQRFGNRSSSRLQATEYYSVE
jgi:hypothetical protein